LSQASTPHSMTEPDRAPRVIWCETQRELPSLRRGWRTPDPSPTRDAAGLPGYALKLCVAPPVLDPDEPSLLEFTPGDRLGDASSSEDRSTATHPPSYNEPAFVSPPLLQEEFQQETSLAGDTVYEDGRKSPSLRHSATATQPTSFSEPAFVPSPPLQTEFRPETSLAGDAAQQDSSTSTQPACSSEPCFVPPPPLEKELQQEMGSAEGAASKQSKAQVSEIGSQTDKTDETDQSHVLVVSVGSVGHPHSCAGACKFAKKKSRGCKDGSACLRCHLCIWTRRSSRQKGPPSAQPAKPL